MVQFHSHTYTNTRRHECVPQHRLGKTKKCRTKGVQTEGLGRDNFWPKFDGSELPLGLRYELWRWTFTFCMPKMVDMYFHFNGFFSFGQQDITTGWWRLNTSSLFRRILLSWSNDWMMLSGFANKTWYAKDEAGSSYSFISQSAICSGSGRSDGTTFRYISFFVYINTQLQWQSGTEIVSFSRSHTYTHRAFL